MNDRHSQLGDLERSLRALAEEDCGLEAPPHVEAVVMQTWDAVRPFDRHRRRRRSHGAPLLAIGSMAAAIVGAVVVYRAPSESGEPQRFVERVAEEPRAVTDATPSHNPRAMEPRAPRPPQARTKREAPQEYQPGMVLVADPILDAGATSVVRVRVPRTALVTLGIPLVEPDDGGSVDLEMLVGEDGVARTIRRAVPVAVRQE